MRTIYIDKEKIGKLKSKIITWILYNQSKREDIVVALSDKSMKNELLNKSLKDKGIKVLDGRWIIKFLLLDILEYVAWSFHCQDNNECENSLEDYKVAILMDKADEIVLAQIEEIALKVKSLKIVTNNSISYRHIEEELFNKNGIAIQITNNKEKSLSKLDVILNLDFNEERLKEYKINDEILFINLGTKMNLNEDVFFTKVINNIEIDFDEHNYASNITKECYNKNILYESFIYRRDTYANIKKQLISDKVKIVKIIS